MDEENRNYEAEAKEQGWNPDFEGDNKVDAQTFVEKGEKIAGILKSKNTRLENRIQILESSSQAMLAANKDFGAYKDGQLAKEKQKSADLLAELETRRATAITDADGAEFTRIDREIQQVRDNLSVPKPNAEPTNGPDVIGQAWLLNNDWYNTNRKLHTYADAVSDEIVESGYVGGSSAYYSELSRRVKEDFPEEFESKPQRQPSVETGGTLEVKSDSNSQNYDNLPPEAKAACDRYVASGHSTKESYCASYDWD